MSTRSSAVSTAPSVLGKNTPKLIRKNHRESTRFTAGAGGSWAIGDSVRRPLIPLPSRPQRGGSNVSYIGKNFGRITLGSRIESIRASRAASLVDPYADIAAQRPVRGQMRRWHSLLSLDAAAHLRKKSLDEGEIDDSPTNLPYVVNTTLRPERGDHRGNVSGNSSAHGASQGGSTVFFRSNNRIQRPEDLIQGVIFSTAQHLQDWDQGPLDPRRSEQSSSVHGNVLSKYRKFVVVATYNSHVVALPICTYNGQGLSRKSREYAAEHVSIRDSQEREYNPRAETYHGILYSHVHPQATGRGPFNYMTDQTSVHFTNPFAHRLDRTCALVGLLDAESVRKLVDLYKNAVLEGVDREELTPTKNNFGHGSRSSSTNSSLYSHGVQSGVSSIIAGREDYWRTGR